MILLAGPELLLADQVENRFGRDEIPPKTHSVSGLKHIFFAIPGNISGRKLV